MYNNGEIEYKNTPLDDAYAILEEAENAKNEKEAIKLAKKAYEKSSECFDAILFQCDLEENGIKRIKLLDDGLDEMFPFLNGWFIEKCMWSSRNLLKETVASLKKFYQYMSENNYVDVIDYKKAFDFIKDNMDELLESIDEFNNFDEDDYYDLF